MSETFIPSRRRAFVDESPSESIPANRSGRADLQGEVKQLRADLNILRNVVLDQAVTITSQEASLVALAELAIQTGGITNQLLRAANATIPPKRTDV